MLLPSEFDYENQSCIPMAYAALHNWVRMEEGGNANVNLHSLEESDMRQSFGHSGDDQAPPPATQDEHMREAMNRFRDALAERMWRDY